MKYKISEYNYDCLMKKVNRQEVDLIEDRDGKLFGFEFKWNSKKQAKAPKAFKESYRNAQFECITPENFLEFDCESLDRIFLF